MNILDLSSCNPERFFIVGGLEGNKSKLIDILFEQQFSHRDILVLAGNFIDIESLELIDLLYFLRNNENCFSVMGKREADFVEKSQQNELPEIFEELQKDGTFDVISQLPSLIKVSDTCFVVNSGIEPYKELDEQDSRVFYSIGEYDSESRYYQYHNPKESSWYDHDFKNHFFCFTNEELNLVEVPAGYNLGSSESILFCLIVAQGENILIEAPSEDLYYQTPNISS